MSKIEDIKKIKNLLDEGLISNAELLDSSGSIAVKLNLNGLKQIKWKNL